LHKLTGLTGEVSKIPATRQNTQPTLYTATKTALSYK
jgi:hypothetical protein